MSATEIIELIKKLPPEEQTKVFVFGDEERTRNPDAASRLSERERARAVSKGVFDRHPELFRKLAR